MLWVQRHVPCFFSGNVMGTEACPYCVLDVNLPRLCVFRKCYGYRDMSLPCPGCKLIKTLCFSGNVMGTEACPYSVLDVAQLLQTRYAFISGKMTYSCTPDNEDIRYLSWVRHSYLTHVILPRLSQLDCSLVVLELMHMDVM